MDLQRFDTGLLQATIARALARGGDFAEVYVEDRESLGIRLEDGRIEQTSGGRELGAAVRLLSGERTYYAFSDALDEEGLSAAADAVAAAVRAGNGGPSVVELGAVRGDPGRHPVRVPPDTVEVTRKAALVRAGDEAARAAGAEIVQATVGYGDTRQRVLIANSLGELVYDDRTRTRFTAQVVARRGEVIQTGHETVGGSAGFELVDEAIARETAATAAEKARIMLDSRPAPVGAMPVVMANGFGGTLFHEACGHGLEADAIAKGASIYAGKMGQIVAAPNVSAFDDGSLTNGWGSQAFDDEGVPTQKTPVIDQGRLTGYLYDRLRARQMGAAPTGNGRRQSFRHVPIPRMTTTYIAPGDADADDIIAATPHGFYAKSLAGGQVEPASGSFVFGVAEGYLIEGGRLTTPLRGATLIGNGIDILMKIDMIAGDFDVKTGVCGKDGQGVPVGTGQATLRIAEMTVGGDRLMFDIVDAILERAHALGLGQVEVYAERSVSRRLKVFGQEVEQLTAAQRRGVGVRVFAGGAVGHAYGSDLSDGGLDDIVRRAVDHAAVSDADEYAALPERGGAPADVHPFDERLVATTDDQRIELALAVEAAALAADSRVKTVEDAMYVDGDGEVFIASSAGVRGSYRANQCYTFVYALAEQDGQVETGYSYAVGRALEDLDAEACGREAGERACRLLGAAKCPSMKAPVVLDPFVSAAFFGVLSSALTADAVQKGRSLFAGREGQQVAGELLQLDDDGTLPDGLDSAPFDGEGTPCRRTPLIGGGVLQGFLYDTYTARKAGRGSTGNGLRGSYSGLPGVHPTNLVVSGPTTPLADIIAGIDRGVLVTDAVGVHSGANPISGEFSVGIAGVLIESGRLTTPVHEVTLAGDIISMLTGIRALGDDARWVPGGSILTPSVVIDGMAIGGT